LEAKTTLFRAVYIQLEELQWHRDGRNFQPNDFKEFAALTISVEKALAYFATHPEEVLGLFGCYCEESGLELKQAA
jgi:hypothetical protein